MARVRERKVLEQTPLREGRDCRGGDRSLRGREVQDGGHDEMMSGNAHKQGGQCDRCHSWHMCHHSVCVPTVHAVEPSRVKNEDVFSVLILPA